MKLEICDKRQALLDESGHVLVTGGPGCGKTTIALVKGKRRVGSLEPEQSILFLSFSRSAVQQIRDRTRHLLTTDERRRMEISTYHLFCLRLLETHGGMLGGRPPRILYPTDERLRRAADPDGWEEEKTRLATVEGRYAFDMLAPSVATLLERSKAVRDLITDKYPLIFLDEFQDTNDDQWRVVRSLGEKAVLVALGDPEQRIFGYQGTLIQKG